MTLEGLRHCTGHPLAREFHFQVVLLGLAILRYNINLDPVARWRLKDMILSAGLRWFAHQPRYGLSALTVCFVADFGRWSFGGNRLQIKAETRLMSDVNAALRASTHIGSKAEGNLQTLETKETLLHILLENEQMRLVVWLYPLDHERRHIFTSPSAKISQEVAIYVQNSRIS